MATHSGRSYNSHQLANRGQLLPASGGVGAKVGDLRSPLVVRFHPLKVANRRIPSAVDKFEPPSEVSNFDQTATKKRIILQVRPAGAAAPSPPTPPAARLKEPKSKVTCVRPRVR
jgi:hypothetical protein